MNMNQILLLFSFLILFFCLVKTTTQTNFKKINSKPLFGANILESGFDERTLNLTTEISPKMKIFEFNWNSLEKIELRSDIIEYYPSDDIDAFPLTYSSVVSSYGYLETFTQFIKQYISGYSISVGAKIYNWTCSLNYQREVGDTKIRLEQKQSTTTFAEGIYHNYKVVSSPSFILTLSKPFTKSIKYLSSRIITKKDKSNWLKFILAFGTSYITEAYLGGKFHYNTYFNSNWLHKQHQHWVNEELGFSFQYYCFFLSGSYFRNRSDIKISDLYKKNSHFKINFYGGVNKYQSNFTQKEWLNSLPEKPYPVNLTALPLSDLVDDPEKSNTLFKAIGEYIKTGTIKTEKESAQELMKLSLYKNGVTKKDKSNLFKRFNYYDYNTIPGYRFVSSSVDRVNLSPKKEVFKLSFDKQKIYTERSFGQSFLVPDQMEVIKTEARSDYNLSVVVDDVEFSDLKISRTYSSSTCFGLGKKSKTYTSYIKNYYTENQNMVLNNYKVEFYKLFFKDFFPVLSNSFQKSIQFLPKNYNQSLKNRKIYQQFIQFYGTDYIVSSQMGGTFDARMYFNKCFLDRETETWIQKQSSISLSDIITYGKHSLYHDKSVDMRICQYCNFELKKKGGDQSLLYQEWVNSLNENNITPINFDLRPLYDLINDKEKKESLKLAINDYVKNQVKEVDNWIKTLKPKPKPKWCSKI